MSETAAVKKSELARITGVYFEPKAAFADIAAHPRWWVPLVLVILMQVCYMYAFSQRVGWEQFMRHQMESNTMLQQQLERVPAEQRERMIVQQAKMASTFGYVGAVLGFSLFALAIAGVFKGVFAISGYFFTFRQGFAVTCYASLVGLFSGVLALIVMYIKDPADFDLQNPLAFNAGAFLDPNSTARWVKSMADSLDLFSFWTMALLATGFAAAAGKITWGASMARVVVLWLAWIVLKAGWVSMF